MISSDRTDPFFDLMDIFLLLMRQRRNFLRMFFALVGIFQNLVNVTGRCLSKLRALFYRLDGGIDQFGRILSGNSTLVYKVAHFIGNNSNLFAGTTGPGGLHRSVKGKNIGLERNILDGFNSTPICAAFVVKRLASAILCYVFILGGVWAAFACLFLSSFVRLKIKLDK